MSFHLSRHLLYFVLKFHLVTWFSRQVIAQHPGCLAREHLQGFIYWGFESFSILSAHPCLPCGQSVVSADNRGNQRSVAAIGQNQTSAPSSWGSFQMYLYCHSYLQLANCPSSSQQWSFQMCLPLDFFLCCQHPNIPTFALYLSKRRSIPA